MAEFLCGICNTNPKKYKCPTCALPYCSIACFKEHKSVHTETAPPPSTTSLELDLPNPPIPVPIPKYLRSKTDFSRLGTDTQFQDLIKTNPTLLPVLQRIYAATIEPEEDDEPRGRGRCMRGRGGFRGRGRGRGGRRAWFGGDERPKWTPKKGDSDAMVMLKGLRGGKRGDEEREAIGEFVRLVGDMFGEEKKMGEEVETMDTS